MEPTANGGQDYLVCDCAALGLRVRINSDVVEHLAQEIHQHHQVGTEACGLLLGVVEEPSQVRVDDFEPVHPQVIHPQEASSAASPTVWSEMRSRWESAGTRSSLLAPVGVYQSWCGSTTPPAPDLAWMPTNPGWRAFLFVLRPDSEGRLVGALFEPAELITLEKFNERAFPMRGRPIPSVDLRANANLLRASAMDRSHQHPVGFAQPEASADNEPSPSSPNGGMQAPAPSEPQALPSVVGPRRIGLRTNWLWLPLSFVFLLLGTVLGFQVAVSLRSALPSEPSEDPYRLDLTATPSAQAVHLHWNRYALAVRNATEGRLIIRDADREHVVQLDLAHLRNGSVIYRPTSQNLQFRLEIATGPNTTVAETLLVNLAGKAPTP